MGVEILIHITLVFSKATPVLTLSALKVKSIGALTGTTTATWPSISYPAIKMLILAFLPSQSDENHLSLHWGQKCLGWVIYPNLILAKLLTSNPLNFECEKKNLREQSTIFFLFPEFLRLQ